MKKCVFSVELRSPAETTTIIQLKRNGFETIDAVRVGRIINSRMKLSVY
jgi:hypothetical protein